MSIILRAAFYIALDRSQRNWKQVASL